MVHKSFQSVSDAESVIGICIFLLYAQCVHLGLQDALVTGMG